VRRCALKSQKVAARYAPGIHDHKVSSSGPLIGGKFSKPPGDKCVYLHAIKNDVQKVVGRKGVKNSHKHVATSNLAPVASVFADAANAQDHFFFALH